MSYSIYQQLEQFLGENRVKENVDLSSYLTMRTRTLAPYFFEARTRQDLIAAKKASLALNIPLIIIGGGSNLIVLHQRRDFIVVKNNYLTKEIISKNDHELVLSVSSGYPTSKLVNEMVEEGWKGFEYFMGLPGTVGGAIVMDSKWTKNDLFFTGNVVYTNFIDEKGTLKKVDQQDIGSAKGILLEVIFKLKKGDPKELAKRVKEALEYRRLTQPAGVYSSGCFFKNISQKEKIRLNLPTTSSGYLIDRAGLKNLSVGDFYVSPKHANFIVNKGGGKVEDLLELINIIKTKVKEKFDVSLNEEVIIR